MTSSTTTPSPKRTQQVVKHERQLTSTPVEAASSAPPALSEIGSDPMPLSSKSTVSGNVDTPISIAGVGILDSSYVRKSVGGLEFWAMPSEDESDSD